MTASDPHTDLQPLPHGWRNLWRAQVESLPADVGCEPFTIFVRAAGRDAAHLAIRRALQAMFPAAFQELDQAYDSLSSAPELVDQGLSARHVDRLFESAWMGDKVEGWVRAPVFVVPEAPALYAAWMTAQLDHSSQYASLALVPPAGIVAGESAPAAQRAAKPQAEAAAAPTVTPIRHHNGFLIVGDRLVINVHPSGGRDQIDIHVSATTQAIAQATGKDRDRGASLGLDAEERLSFDLDEIRIEGDVLNCAAQSPFMARYAPGVTDYREGFTVTLEPGQAGAVRHAVAQLGRVLAGQRAVVDHLQPWLSGVKPSAWYVEAPVFDLVVARVLDGADQAAALAAFDRAAHTLPAEARQRVADPALWAALDHAAGPAPV
ncbi:Uncharacterised protein [Achromobacter xylosoxidans]|uniref:hypothetical protein n=1 Tax=Achromobacter TaxID=222 RepID=UPI0006C5B6FD|nr:MULTISPECIES: hypothetical protein [Achromobacter]CAB3920209.1 hypothetical protein LMG26846_05540 [Achromobacter insuavis]CUJ32272.1 Uncharacterised protein [Achromobacter xylosoxidans]CUJ40828.1 Uncharacterised protein [Achromobacter sp. 2789STDY5608621]